MPAYSYYTELSNYTAMLASVLLVLSLRYEKLERTSVLFRYIATCMLTITFLIVFLVLLPFGGDPYKLLVEGNCIPHHILVPVLSFISYLFFEKHVRKVRLFLIPAFLTWFYGNFLILLNGLHLARGPYPFLQTNVFGVPRTLFRAGILTIIVSAISLAVLLLAKRAEKRQSP